MDVVIEYIIVLELLKNCLAIGDLNVRHLD